MKSKPHYEIHALIGKCHLHSKKKNTYSITLKIGNKNIAFTDYRQPQNDQINFNTELILKIDKLTYEGVGKLSVIVSMLNEEKQKKIIGSIFANYKQQKGQQYYRICPCSCKNANKYLEIGIEFEVISLQQIPQTSIPTLMSQLPSSLSTLSLPNHNKKYISPNKKQQSNSNIIKSNSYLQSPRHHRQHHQSPINQSQMKELKSTLSMSQHPKIKNSRTKKYQPQQQQSNLQTNSKTDKFKTPTKSQHLQNKHYNETLSPNEQSELTTKITPSALKLNEQSKQYVQNLKEQINRLQKQVKSMHSQTKVQNNHLFDSSKQFYMMEKQIHNLQQEKQCIIQILKLQEQKNSAAINYIQILINQFIRLNLLKELEKDFVHVLTELLQENISDQTYAGCLQQYQIQQKQQFRQNIKNFQKQEEERSKQGRKSSEEAAAEGLPVTMMIDQQQSESNKKINPQNDPQIIELTVQIEELNKKLTQSKRYQSELQVEHKNEVMDFLQKTIQFQDEVKTLKQSLQHLEIQNKSLNIQNHSLTHKIKQLQRVILEEKQSKQTLEQKIQTDSLLIVELKQSIQTHREQIQSYKDIKIRYDIAQKRQQQAIVKIKRLEEQIETLEQQQQQQQKCQQSFPSSSIGKKLLLKQSPQQQNPYSTCTPLNDHNHLQKEPFNPYPYYNEQYQPPSAISVKKSTITSYNNNNPSKMQTQDKQQLNSMINQIVDLISYDANNEPKDNSSGSNLLIKSRQHSHNGISSHQQLTSQEYPYPSKSHNKININHKNSNKDTEPTYGNGSRSVDETQQQQQQKQQQQHQKEHIKRHKYNYNYDLDSVNYFNNFEDYQKGNDEGIESSSDD